MSQHSATMARPRRARFAPVALLFVVALLLAVTTLLLPRASLAQTGTDPGDELVTINMRDADIRAVVQWIAEQTHKQIVIDPRVQGRVTVLADRPMTVDQAYQVFLALLDTNGYAASETGGVLRIYPSALAKTSPRELVESFTGNESGGQVLHVMQLQQVAAANLVELLKPLLGAGGHVAALGETNSLLIADSADNARRLTQLAQRMDRSGSLDIDVVKLRHAGAREAAQVLTSLTGGGQSGGQGGGNQSMPLLAAADERSNSVLITGDPVNRRRARDLLAQLDQPITTRGNTRVIYLHYLDAEEALPILRGMVDSKQQESKDEETRAASVSIEASTSNNALVLSGPPALLDDMEQVIDRLDIRRAQVMVEALIVEVSTELGDRLGVEWSSSLNGEGVEGVTRFNNRPDSDSGVVDGLLDLATSGLTLGYYRNGSLRALITALATSSHANILSTPSLLTLDNQEAQILVGSNVPIVTGQVTNEASGTDNPFTTIEREDIGVTLKIKPHVNAGDAVTLDVLQEVETLADATNIPGLGAVEDIVTNKRSLSTKVVVDDDTILVLGGLIRDEQQETVSKVPILGDMPLVGALFRSTSTSTVKSNLMIFIRPVIVDSEAVADSVTRKAYDGMRSQQLKYNDGKFIDKAQPVALPEFDAIEPRKPAPTPAGTPLSVTP